MLHDRQPSVSAPTPLGVGAATASPRRREGPPTFAEEVSFLRRATSYPPPPSPVEPIETAASWVFLTGDLAFKLAKPRPDDAGDLRSLRLRRRRCDEELRLNRRLAPGVHLAVEPLTWTGEHLELGGDGEAVDWLLRMKRLPAAHMLDQRLASGDLRVAEVRQLGERLAHFHAEAPRSALDGGAYRTALAAGVERHFRQLSDAGEALLPRAVLVALCSELLAFLVDEAAAFDDLVRAGRVVEGQGDLRPEHVCLLPEPLVLDCAVDSTLRRDVDGLDEVACLAMECERLGEEWVGPELLASHARLGGDAPLPSLVSFYKSVRAAEAAALALGEPADGLPWAPRELAVARAYACLAARHGAALR